MLQTIESINNAVNNFIWGVPAMICIIGVGLYLSLRTGFIQIRKFPYALKTTLGRIFKKKEASDGSLTPFQAVCTAPPERSVPEISPVSPVRSRSAVRVPCSGCGSPQSLECVRNSLRSHLPFISANEIKRVIMSAVRCTTSKTD